MSAGHHIRRRRFAAADEGRGMVQESTGVVVVKTSISLDN
jgi:hypothetical protein